MPQKKSSLGPIWAVVIAGALLLGVNIEIKKGITAKDKVRGPEVVSDDDKK